MKQQTVRRPLLPWSAVFASGWMITATLGWPVLGLLMLATSGLSGANLSMDVLELTATGGVLIGICQLSRRGIPFRFRDQRGPTMNVLCGASMCCGAPALVWVTALMIHAVVPPVVAGVVVFFVGAHDWSKEIVVWSRGATTS